ncbi:nucleotide disphospho-sugar-binding domain-containing protein [Kitasatospora sp. NPDC018058]|uniref:nucleotide disphospho-sugar-binding domain-containing protein n=1 Tax=Kitasatospora sp. NPDC018058 TaxID=3364025 RepID=UPI0037C0098C
MKQEIHGMRVVLSTYGSRGDVQPLAGLAVRLRELGAQVRVCAPPDEEFAELLAGIGVELVPVGQSVRELVTGPRLAASEIPDRAATLVAQFYDAIIGAAEPGDAVVATGLFAAIAGARSAAEKLGLPFTYLALQPTVLPSAQHRPFEYPIQPYPEGVTDIPALWDLNIGAMNALFGEAVNSHRASVGLPPVDNVRDHVIADRPLLATDPVLDLWEQSDGLGVMQTGAWTLPDERPLPADLVAFLDAGEPPVYVGFGSMPLSGAQDTARVAVEAVRAQGRRLLLGRGWAQLAQVDDASDCFAVGEVNQQALFPRVAAVVHHGGAGTTTTAARAGTPQVVVPQIVDQPYWAGRVAALGIGVAHDGPTVTVDSLSLALKEALMPETLARATEVAATISTDGTTVAAKLLLDADSRAAAPAAPFAPVLTRHGDAETCADPSSVMRLFADSDGTADGFTSYRSTFAKGAVGAPAHFHTKATEIFFVISGSLQVLVGEEITVLDAGALAATLAEAEAAGYDPGELLQRAREQRELGSADSVTAVMVWRVRRLAKLSAAPPAPAPSRPATGPVQPPATGPAQTSEAARRPRR